MTIGPVTHHLTKAEGMTRPTFDVVAGAVTLTVAPYPGAGRPLAARHFTVQDEFSKDPAELREGETLTRRITLTAEGTMAHLLPARPEIREPWLISFTAPEIRETRLTAEGPSPSRSGNGACAPIPARSARSCRSSSRGSTR
ncbi:hypothetical protein QWZ10_14630 [Paracoccus cavernae]|uniref:Uncharacterized protein n=1 Tax=Paracoccus cavernae TaxID=1571207 RepID=A0ABT8D7B3_9RHOB|nr:hypothetical protein [Paracoccus cavernae]